jgi:pimeloyl-ACP methyl ester carboxylesterase/membrane protein DedA with SNARE-associated domain
MTRRFRLRSAIIAYFFLLLASQLTRAARREVEVPREERVLQVGAVSHDRVTGRQVRLALFDSAPATGSPAPPVVVLLHGSPGDHHEVLRLGKLLADEFRVLAPDLPGFGASSRSVPDYSFRAHAHYVIQLLDSLHIPRAHLIGFSMGGGVALSFADLAPERVASLTMLSAIGAQEYELTGDYYLNHLAHGLQLVGLWLIQNGVPQFGLLDGMLTIPYARNFYDSDQRPLRGILSRYAGPMLIVQGKEDPLVPAAIALEHARLVPQSEMLMLEGNHFMTFARPRLLAPPIAAFIERAEVGLAPGRAAASPERLRAAAEPFDPRRIPPASGIGLAVLLLLIAAATLVSEDFTCIATGLLVSRGTLGFLPGTLACMVGIVTGDLGLYGVGRLLGRNRLGARFAAASAWLNRRGPIVVLTTRFVPGSRLPTYLAAGMLHARLLPFAGYFLLAAALWTPLLVGLAMLSGDAAPMLFANWRRWSFPLVAVAGLVLLALVKLIVPLFSWRGRRLLRSRWRRLARWEFWPRWAFYPPIVLYVLRLGLKHRSLTLFSAANPAIPGGGFVGESKWHILEGLRGGLERSGTTATDVLPATALIPGGPATLARVRLAESFMEAHRLAWPLVLKPDIGERGDGVAIVHSVAELRDYFEQAGGDVLAQEYVPGLEFGVFYYRLPGEDRGRIFSLTEKRLPSVRGDGQATLERLILQDERGLSMAGFFLRQHARRLWEVPGPGEVVPIGELGTHCLGAAFYDGEPLKTAELEARVDAISKAFEGFWFGRYDVRAESEAAFRAGRFRIIELNGATSEATSIYDPKHTLREGYATLREQWRIGFEIGARNRAAGIRPATLSELLALFRQHQAARRLHAKAKVR